MGRELKRVALDFQWPLDKPWEGFLLPDNLQGEKCPDCDGGQTPAGWWIQTFAQRIAMLGSDVGDQRRGHQMHPWLQNDPYPHGHWDNYHQYVVDRPSEDILELFAALSKYVDREHEPDHFTAALGDSYFIYRVLDKVASEMGLEGWAICKTCNGEGEIEKYEGQFAERDAWEPYEPPAGEGWQVWETVSEGSPITRVFATAGALINHLVTVGAWGKRWQRESAERFVRDTGWAPSGMVIGGTFYSPENMPEMGAGE